MNAVPKNIVAILEALPGYGVAAEIAAGAAVAERKRQLDEIARLDRDAESRWKSQEAAMAKTAEKVRVAERVLKSVGDEHARGVNKVFQERGAYEHKRRQCELLLMTATRELVDGFESAGRRELDRLRDATTSAAVEPRLKAILRTIRTDLPRLRLFPDVSALPDEFDRIRASWPALSAEPTPALTRGRPAPDGMGFAPRGSIT